MDAEEEAGYEGRRGQRSKETNVEGDKGRRGQRPREQRGAKRSKEEQRGAKSVRKSLVDGQDDGSSERKRSFGSS